MRWYKFRETVRATPDYVEWRRGWREKRIDWNDIVLIQCTCVESFTLEDEVYLIFADRSGQEIAACLQQYGFYDVKSFVEAKFGISKYWDDDIAKLPGFETLWCKSAADEHAVVEAWKEEPSILMRLGQYGRPWFSRGYVLLAQAIGAIFAFYLVSRLASLF